MNGTLSTYLSFKLIKCNNWSSVRILKKNSSLEVCSSTQLNIHKPTHWFSSCCCYFVVFFLVASQQLQIKHATFHLQLIEKILENIREDNSDILLIRHSESYQILASFNHEEGRWMSYKCSFKVSKGEKNVCYNEPLLQWKYSNRCNRPIA